MAIQKKSYSHKIKDALTSNNQGGKGCLSFKKELGQEREVIKAQKEEKTSNNFRPLYSEILTNPDIKKLLEYDVGSKLEPKHSSFSDSALLTIKPLEFQDLLSGPASLAYKELEKELHSEKFSFKKCLDSFVNYLRKCPLDKFQIARSVKLASLFIKNLGKDGALFYIQFVATALKLGAVFMLTKQQLRYTYDNLTRNLQFLGRIWFNHTQFAWNHLKTLHAAILNQAFIDISDALDMLESCVSTTVNLLKSATSFTNLESFFGEFLSEVKNRADTFSSYLTISCLIHSIYLNTVRWMAYQSREEALSNLSLSGQVPEEILTEMALTRDNADLALKETNPELYALFKKITRHQSGPNLLMNSLMSTAKLILLAISAVASGGTGLLGIKIALDSVNVGRFAYRIYSKKWEGEELKRWSSLSEDQIYVSSGSINTTLLKERRLIATSISELQGLPDIEQFRTDAVKKYLNETQDPITNKINTIESILKRDSHFQEYTHDEKGLKILRSIAKALATDAKRFMTKRIQSYLYQPTQKQKNRIQEIEKLLARKANALKIKWDSRFAAIRLYQRIKNIPENLAKGHPMQVMLGPITPEFLKKATEGAMSQEALEYLLGKTYFS